MSIKIKTSEKTRKWITCIRWLSYLMYRMSNNQEWFQLQIEEKNPMFENIGGKWKKKNRNKKIRWKVSTITTQHLCHKFTKSVPLHWLRSFQKSKQEKKSHLQTPENSSNKKLITYSEGDLHFILSPEEKNLVFCVLMWKLHKVQYGVCANTPLEGTLTGSQTVF